MIVEVKPNIDLSYLEALGDPVSPCDFDIELGSNVKLATACSAFDVRASYLALTFVAMSGVRYEDLSGTVIKIKAIDSRTAHDVVVISYKLTNLKGVFASGLASGHSLGLPNVMSFEQRYAYEFVGIESK